MRLAAVSFFIFGVITKVNAEPVSKSQTASTTPGSHDPAITSRTTTAYYNPTSFINPYFWYIIATSGEAVESSLQSCAATWASSFQTWLETAPITTGPLIDPTTKLSIQFPWVTSQALATRTYSLSNSIWTSTFPSVFKTYPPSTHTITSAGQGPYYYVPTHLDFTASEPCCQSCTLFGGSVEVFYWPSTTESPPVSALPSALPSTGDALLNAIQPHSGTTLVNGEGFKFVSPSIYVAFQSLYASNLCGDVGPRYDRTTLAFAPGELSTSNGLSVSNGAWPVAIQNNPDLTWTKATFGDHANECGPKLSPIWMLGAMGYLNHAAAVSAAAALLAEYPMPGTEISDLVATYMWTSDPCKPTLSIPSQILTLNSAWSACEAPLTAFFDPPYALSTGNGLFAVGVKTNIAAPGPTAAPEIAAVTTTPPAAAPVVTPPPSIVDTPTPPSRATIEVQPVQIHTPGDALPPSPSPNSPANPDSDPEAANPEVTQPVAGTPGGNDGSQPNPVQTPAGQNPAGEAPDPAESSFKPVPVFSLGSSAFTADQSTNFMIAAQTLTPGGEVTVLGTRISLSPNGNFAVIDGTSTQAVATGSIAAGQPPPVPGSYNPDVTATIDASISLLAAIPPATPSLSTFPSSSPSTFSPTPATRASIGGIIITIGGFETPSAEVPGVASGSNNGSGNYNGTFFTGSAARTDSERSLWGLALISAAGLLGVWWL